MSHNLKTLTDLSELQDKLFKDAESLEQQIQVGNWFLLRIKQTFMVGYAIMCCSQIILKLNSIRF